jgi:23S rRNA pseudouridine2605 synthase
MVRTACLASFGRRLRVFSTQLARVLSKLGFCSRADAQEMIHAGRVRVNGRIVRNPDHGIDVKKAVIEVDGQRTAMSEKVYVMLNKPRGLVTTTADERGRETVYECFRDSKLPRIVPVGRLDKATEGLLLFTNDNAWADAITNPESEVSKTYHAQINRMGDQGLVERIKSGQEFRVRDARIVRTGERNSWLEIVLDEGKNRHIRRLLDAFGIEVLRLIRIRVGELELGDLAKGQWRHLTATERALAGLSADR